MAMSRTTKVLHALAASSILAVSLAAPAYAGERSSYFTAWHAYSETSNWDDTGNSFGTQIDIRQCTYDPTRTNQWITFQLHRDDTWSPNEDYELRGVDCWATSAYHSGYWGNKGSGAFYWRIRYICGNELPWQTASTKSVLWEW